jgi:hypothetical protein
MGGQIERQAEADKHVRKKMAQSGCTENGLL